MSTQFSVATALCDGRITFASLKCFDRGRPVDLARKTVLVAQADRPPKTAAIEVTSDDGSVHGLGIDDPQPEFSWNLERVRDNAAGLLAETHWDDNGLQVLLERIDDCDRLHSATE
jgi:hypothetical protein